jgi:hypothetical protein
MFKNNILLERRKYCNYRLNRLQKRIRSIPILKKLKDVCIYVTGSYGRFEANKRSDLDIFILKDGNSKTNPILRVDKILLNAELIKITREMRFGEFSNDGQYLQVHHIEDILDDLGSPLDDYKNFFTARMLLLLESYPLYNKKLYNRMIEGIVNSYFRDYHDHDLEFRPIFLVNDIIRYYKTMCLNYEHRRNRRTSDIDKKNSAHLKNLKLKFSRLITCYSLVIAIVRIGTGVKPRQLSKLITYTPIDRICSLNKNNEILIQETLLLYEWFLKLQNKPKTNILRWIGKRSNRDLAFAKGRNFQKNIYELLKNNSTESDFRYLAI